jgi:transcriptional regulator
MTRSIAGDSLRGHLATMLLSSLEAGPAHGFELLKRIEAAGSGLLRLKEGSLYPALYRLERDGLVRAEWESGETARRGPRRRMYSLTAKGRRQLAAGREEWKEFVSIVGAIVGA